MKQHSFLKIEADDNPNIFIQGVFASMYMEAVVSDKDLYLGQCDCEKSMRYGTVIMCREPTYACGFCGKTVKLEPVPRPIPTKVDNEPPF